jgi:hypothetical protein
MLTDFIRHLRWTFDLPFVVDLHYYMRGLGQIEQAPCGLDDYRTATLEEQVQRTVFRPNPQGSVVDASDFPRGCTGLDILDELSKTSDALLHVTSEGKAQLRIADTLVYFYATVLSVLPSNLSQLGIARPV